ncbi:putative undecaprenyl-phosphate N-acetylglucosaminyl 1-phosphate transferase [Nocardioides dokdonensis FR1436]|uniref:Putative undecaprenyl-phosphate N-acetylglucosaminyl 1-phosphate transferase n=1 Tax=Nocardioides dokdonensis FR1436 TaxID=1300347 RepID=A0A1A9GL64_9ACTN|nr:UDP-phosphate glycosyltransferase [Nocardioides dokdonensis]ANH38185.1 putative undecaprenyl-phosphate N-acetylglucosaminyl 1-phosphate transferase [Nocardioides dokdonensis FR1436]
MNSFFISLALTLILVGVFILLLRDNFVDVPNARSSHRRSIPRGGGVAVVAAIAGVSALTVDLGAGMVGLVTAACVLAAVGLIDDWRSLPSSIRLFAQLMTTSVLAVLLVASGEASWWLVLPLAVGMTGFVNAFNFMDGVNGISGLNAAAIGLWWAWAGNAEGQSAIAALGLILAGAAIGFLPWNIPKARVFLGDAGSYGIGVLIAGLSALAVVEGLPWWWALAPLVVYGADTGWALVKRARAGKPLAEAHRGHVYQRLVDGGWPHIAAATACAGATILVCLAAGAARVSLAWWAVALVALIVMAYLSSARLVETARRGS